ncbi:MAG: hypothetical protein AWU55_398 [Halomonadaceae bacterium T82-2]|nr:MAG: hypothetical protein AWU55_398 [Halomonadaceae bacterium T82-2]
MTTAPHWLIIGAGALGRLLAARLTERQPPILIGRRASADPLVMTTPEGQTNRYHVARLTLAEAPSQPSLIHVTTKSHAVAAALDELVARVAPDTPLVLWQNGFQAQPLATRRWTGPALCAVTSEGAYTQGENEVVHAGHGLTHLGHLEGRYRELAISIAAELTAAGIETRACDDIRRRLWHKLAVNAAINPLVAIHRIRNGELRDPAYQPHVEAIVDDVAAIMAAEQVEPPEIGWQAHVQGVIEATAGNRASMLQDVLAGRRTERDAILGPLLEAARRHALHAPTLERLWHDTPQ